MADRGEVQAPSVRVWAGLVWDRWVDRVRHRSFGAILTVLVAATAVAAWFFHLNVATTAAFGGVTLAWAAGSIPFAAYEAWREERLARIAAEDVLAAQVPATLRMVAFELARELRNWLKAISDANTAAVTEEFNHRFRGRVEEVWSRLELARFPHGMMPLTEYFRFRAPSKEGLQILAGDLDIWANALPADFPA